MAKAKPKQADPVEALADALSAQTPRLSPIPREDFLSTGCTLFNIALSGDPDLGIPKGTYVYLVGESSSGKTWWGHVFFAEAAINPSFDKYRFVFDNAENGALMDIERFFGRGVLDRLEAPHYDKKENPVYSTTVQELYFHLAANVKRGPCIYLVDSMDALNDDADDAQFEAAMTKHFTGKGEVPGNMGMNKAKTNSRNINRIAQLLRTNGSILVVLSQTRSKVNSQYAGQRTRSGGDALKFYSHIEVWMKVKEVLHRTHLRKDREFGSRIEVDVHKNRVSGWEGKLPLINFLKGHGIDDVGTCVDYLLDERHWGKPEEEEKKTKKDVSFDDDDDEEEKKTKRFAAPEFDFVGKPEQLISVIEKDGREAELRQAVAKVWRDILAGLIPKRKNRYG